MWITITYIIIGFLYFFFLYKKNEKQITEEVNFLNSISKNEEQIIGELIHYDPFCLEITMNLVLKSIFWVFVLAYYILYIIIYKIIWNFLEYISEKLNLFNNQ